MVSIERGSGEGPFALRPPKTAQRVIEVVATEMGAETGSLKVGRLLLDGEDDIAAGSYMFKPVYNARKSSRCCYLDSFAFWPELPGQEYVQRDAMGHLCLSAILMLRESSRGSVSCFASSACVYGLVWPCSSMPKPQRA